MVVAAGQSVRVRVPATSANLGPGFDALGLALDLHDELVLTPDRGEDLQVHIDGFGADSLPRDERHLLVRTIRTAASRYDVDIGGFTLQARNAIPQGRGLGSSAATIVAGVAVVLALGWPDAELDVNSLLALAAEVEGHPDNVAACVLGGLTISWQDGAGARAVTMGVHRDVAPVVLVPDMELATHTARGLLPASVPHADAAFTAGRSALLVHALTAAPQLLMAATEERLHERYRAPAMPDSARLIEALRSAGIPAVVSGAGPSVLTFPPAGADPQAWLPTGWTSLRLAAARGVEVAMGGERE